MVIRVTSRATGQSPENSVCGNSLTQLFYRFVTLRSKSDDLLVRIETLVNPHSTRQRFSKSASGNLGDPFDGIGP